MEHPPVGRVLDIPQQGAGKSRQNEMEGDTFKIDRDTATSTKLASTIFLRRKMYNVCVLLGFLCGSAAPQLM